ncbi:uncharacterized protein LOC132752156 [Ruditapes philippinarum]|uniref:uncharacterized protein LOC132752156 n=1 Tax=Ruditapes philippinarum TaxID=129788 RepID=UPI00295A5F85|nr:uncharacterized protein LOC132752156 [Ruditapes philippinarum]
MELLASGVPDKVDEGRTSPALSQCSTDSHLSEQSSLSASQHADVHGLVKGSVSWTHEAIMLLIDRRRELNHLFESSTVTSCQAWLYVAADLKEKGHDYSWEDCRKMVSLKNTVNNHAKTKKKTPTAYDDEPPQWFAEYQRNQQKMHEEKMALDTRRVSALEYLVKLLQNQQLK